MHASGSADPMYMHLSLSLRLSLCLSLSLYALFPSIENHTVLITAEATNVASERMCNCRSVSLSSVH